MSRPNPHAPTQPDTARSAGLHNLPVHPTPILGRARDVRVIVDKLLRDDVRLVTLEGPGGVGKTRLAVQVAEEVAHHFADGVWFVGLATIADHALVVPTIAQTLDLHAKPGQALTALDLVKAALRDRETLLVLDNFEQVMPAAPDLAVIMSSCPGLKLLATSRSPLQLRGEQEYPVPPLALPAAGNRMVSVEVLRQYSAVALFQERAAAVRPDFELTPSNANVVVEICARLDGLPLAIELVAARVKLLQPQAILPRLQKRLQLLTGGAQDLPSRQQTMRNAIDWSYGLLTPEEQQLFRRLSVFVGGWTLEAAEIVCDPGDYSGVVLDGIGSLINKSLLRNVETPDVEAEPRYDMLETIREFAAERLEDGGEAEAQRRAHARYFVELAERMEPLLVGATQKECIDRLEREHDNLRAALRWSLYTPDGAEMGMRLVGSLGRFWSSRDYLAEGRRWVESFLTQPQAAGPTALRARVLNTGAALADNQNDWAAVRAYAVERIGIKKRLDDMTNVSGNYVLLAKAASAEEDFDAARDLLEAGIEVARAAGDDLGYAHCANGLGELARLLGDYDTASHYYESCLATFRGASYSQGIGFTLHNLAHVYLHDGDHPRAGALLDEALDLYRVLGNRLGTAMCVAALSGVAIRQGEAQRAARLLGAAQALLESVGALLDPADVMEYRHNEDAARARLGEAAFLAAWAEGHAMTPEQVTAIEGVVDVEAQTGVPEKGAPEGSGSVPPAYAGASGLSARELDVLRLVAEGLSDADVAMRLVLSPHTVRAHLRNIYSKIGVASRSAATRYAADHNLL
jgi:predicted ATPase/DNA-binding CsgD family transcriptional regulator